MIFAKWIRVLKGARSLARLTTTPFISMGSTPTNTTRFTYRKIFATSKGEALNGLTAAHFPMIRTENGHISGPKIAH
jgi:hypothetical protein